MEDWRGLLVGEDREKAWEALEREAFPAGWQNYRDDIIYADDDIGQWSRYGLREIDGDNPREYTVRFQDRGSKQGYIDVEFEAEMIDGVDKHTEAGDIPARAYSFCLSSRTGVVKLGNFVEGIAEELDAELYQNPDDREYELILEKGVA